MPSIKKHPNESIKLRSFNNRTTHWRKAQFTRWFGLYEIYLIVIWWLTCAFQQPCALSNELIHYSRANHFYLAHHLAATASIIISSGAFDVRCWYCSHKSKFTRLYWHNLIKNFLATISNGGDTKNTPPPQQGEHDEREMDTIKRFDCRFEREFCGLWSFIASKSPSSIDNKHQLKIKYYLWQTVYFIADTEIFFFVV